MRGVTNTNYIIRYLVLLLLGMMTQASQAQQHTLTIQVVDSTLIPVGHATIRINKREMLVDSSGTYTAGFSRGNYRIYITAVGHNPAVQEIFLRSDSTLRFILHPRESLLTSVFVSAYSNVRRNQMSAQRLSITQIKKLPVILGEIDPLKTITLLPGVKNGGEASAGLYIRGGGPDQNLVLLDGIPVYNPNHLLGFFSIFLSLIHI